MPSLIRLSVLTLTLFMPMSATAQLDLPVIGPTPTALDPLGPNDRDSITIEKTLYFLDPDGRYVIAPAGVYLVRAREDLHLVLIPGQGRQALIVQARATAHQETLAEPIVLIVSNEQSDVHVVVLQPGGKGLATMGAVTPTRLRSADMPVPTPEQVQQAFAKKTSGQPAK